jgi:transposase
MYYVGVDVHQSRSSIEILDANGKTVKRFEVKGNWSVLSDRMAQLPKPFSVCYEASCGYGYLHEQFSRYAQTVKVAHPGKLRLIYGSKRKNNKFDAGKLARLLMLDVVPQVHVPPAAVRQWRQTIEFRQRILAGRVRVKNRLRALFRGLAIKTPKNLWSKKSLAWVGGLVLDDASALQRDLLVAEFQESTAKITRVETYLKKVSDKCPAVALLRTMPGIGPRTAEALVAYLDDIKRFARVKQVGCYLGLVPCQDASADKNRLGHITREGPATVRKLLCEATWVAIRNSPTVKGFFERVMRNDKERKKIALVATAHYLSRVAGAMLRTGECWRENDLPPQAQPMGSQPAGAGSTHKDPKCSPRPRRNAPAVGRVSSPPPLSASPVSSPEEERGVR